ncbi:MAG: hypothetical protein ACKN94_03065, partial [Pirellulaceae bacterium]
MARHEGCMAIQLVRFEYPSRQRGGSKKHCQQKRNDRGDRSLGTRPPFAIEDPGSRRSPHLSASRDG